MFEILGRNDVCWCGSGKKYKKCHMAFDERILSYKRKGCIIPDRNIIKSTLQINGIKESSKINIAVLDHIAENIKTGISTEEINQLVHTKTLALGGVPAPLNYEGFPKSVCTSINNQVCHGIPSDEVSLEDGDIINVDVSTLFKGYFSDASRMFCIGNVSAAKRRLVDITKKSIEIGLKQIKPWHFLGDIGQAISDYVISNGYSVVEEFGGHGVGLEFHEEPFVSHVSKRGTEMLLVPGMVFTIEPMINMGRAGIYIDSDNDWVVYTADGEPSAQWEVTVAVTEKGYEILTY
ncbi:methionyl aminopeptidase [Acetobacterium bakii]|uniref:Methionine aminopeptidase n=1 Tax=Acetobacterium bakii TaxID=52689 RepID=A0A0L6TXI7_9FIRM|nr:methionyl aminopeptidase [Acetobacterium bakii]KNZ40963.1 methionine aminopeptidase [Acetobacterium bakii]